MVGAFCGGAKYCATIFANYGRALVNFAGYVRAVIVVVADEKVGSLFVMGLSSVNFTGREF